MPPLPTLEQLKEFYFDRNATLLKYVKNGDDYPLIKVHAREDGYKLVWKCNDCNDTGELIREKKYKTDDKVDAFFGRYSELKIKQSQDKNQKIEDEAKEIERKRAEHYANKNKPIPKVKKVENAVKREPCSEFLELKKSLEDEDWTINSDEFHNYTSKTAAVNVRCNKNHAQTKTYKSWFDKGQRCKSCCNTSKKMTISELNEKLKDHSFCITQEEFEMYKTRETKLSYTCLLCNGQFIFSSATISKRKYKGCDDCSKKYKYIKK